MNKQQEYNQAIECIVELVVEQYRFLHNITRVRSKLDYANQQKLIRQSRWVTQNTEKVLNRLNMRIVDFTGTKYEAGLPVEALSKDCENAVVSEMLEPVIMRDEEVIHTGIVLLRRK